MSVEQSPQHRHDFTSVPHLGSENVLFSADPLPPSPVTGLPDMQRFPDTLGYPEISGGLITVEEYYEHYLRRKHPNWSDSQIKFTINRAMGIQELKDALSSQLKTELEIRREDPLERWLVRGRATRRELSIVVF